MFKKVTNYTILFALTCSQTALAGGEGQGEHASEYRGIRRHYQPIPAQKAQDRPRKHLVLRLRTHGKEGGDDHQNPVSVTEEKARIEADTSRPAKTIFNAPVHLTLAKNTFSAVHNPTIGGSADLAQSYQVNKDNKVNVQFSIPVSINHEQLERFKDSITWGGGGESDLSGNDEVAAQGIQRMRNRRNLPQKTTHRQ